MSLNQLVWTGIIGTVGLFLHSTGFALETDNYFHGFNSRAIEIQNWESIQASTDALSGPLFAKPKPLSSQCDLNLLTSAHLSLEEYQNAASAFFRNCQSQTQIGFDSDLGDFTESQTFKHRFYNNSYMRRVLIHYPNGKISHGLLALKGDDQKRPFIIFRLGIFGELSLFRSERFVLINLFEQSPFNMLIVESNSSADYIDVNNDPNISFGGVDEGMQNRFLGKILRDPNEPLNRLIDSVHLVGMSLGGHGVFFASLLDQAESQNGYHEPRFDSYLQFCPVVDLNATYRQITSSFLKSAAISLLSSERWDRVKARLGVNQSWSFWDFFKNAVEQMVSRYQGVRLVDSEEGLPESIMNSRQFWQASDFWNALSNQNQGQNRAVKKPFQIFDTERDYIVPHDINVDRLFNQSEEFEKYHLFSNARLETYSRGQHCTFPVVTDWDSNAKLFQGYISANLNNQALKETILAKTHSAMMKLDGSIRTKAAVQNYFVVWPKSDQAILRWKLSPLKLPIDLSTLPYRTLDNYSAVDQEMITRWLYHNLSFKMLPGGKELQVSW